MKFIIEQVALYPPDPAKAIELLTALGLDEWAQDLVAARGKVRGLEKQNEAVLNFNYQASPAKPLELEVLKYAASNDDQDNWMYGKPASVSHLGMHCSASSLAEWRGLFSGLGITVAQEVFTYSHTNPVIAGKRIYNYVIFDTRATLGVDLKFIVRYNAEEEEKKDGA